MMVIPSEYMSADSPYLRSQTKFTHQRRGVKMQCETSQEHRDGLSQCHGLTVQRQSDAIVFPCSIPKE